MLDSAVILIFSLLVLGRAAQMIIDSSLTLAKFLRVSEMTVGFLILSVATSLPELFVASIASFDGESGISLGTLLGANIADVGIVLGLAILFMKTRIPLECRECGVLKKILVATSVLPLIMFANLEPLTGLILLIVFAVYAQSILKSGMSIDGIAEVTRRRAARSAVMLCISLLLIVASSKYAVDSAVDIATSFSVSKTFIAATTISLGTTLPELAVSIAAIRRRRPMIAIGNAIGSCITNLTLILGIAALINPLKGNTIALTNLIFFQAVMNLILLYFLQYGKELKQTQGFVLTGTYILFFTCAILLEVMG